MNTQTSKTNTKIRRAIASVALVGMGMATMFTATASASPVDPTDFTFEIDELIEVPIPVISFDPTIDINVSDCPATGVAINITNNYLSLEFFRVNVFHSSPVEVSEDAEFTFSETPDFESGLMMIASGDTEGGPYFTDENVVLVRVYETSPGPVEVVGYGTLILEEEVTICEEGAEAELTEAEAEYAAQVAAEEAAQALAEAQAAAEAAEQAAAEAQAAAEQAAAEVAAAEQAAAEQAAAAEAAAEVAAAEAAAEAAQAAEEAAQAAIDQAQAEKEAAEAALAQAEAEKELALAQAEAEKARAEAILAQSSTNEDVEDKEQDQTNEEVQNTSEDESSDEELAIGEGLTESGKSGMSGGILGLIIALGLVGVAAITGAVLNLRKQR